MNSSSSSASSPATGSTSSLETGSASSPATGSTSASSSGTSRRKRKRKGNIVPAEKEDDTLEDMKARVKRARKKKLKPNTVSGNVKRVTIV